MHLRYCHRVHGNFVAARQSFVLSHCCLPGGHFWHTWSLLTGNCTYCVLCYCHRVVYKASLSPSCQALLCPWSLLPDGYFWHAWSLLIGSHLLPPLILSLGGNFMAALKPSCQAIICPLSLLPFDHFGPLASSVSRQSLFAFFVTAIGW